MSIVPDHVYDRIELDWYGRADVHEAGVLTVRYLKEVIAHTRNPAEDPYRFQVVLDRALDGPDVDPRVVLEALEESGIAFREAEIMASHERRIWLRSTYLTISTRVLHRLNYADLAGRRALQGIVYLEDQAQKLTSEKTGRSVNGDVALIEALAADESNVIAERAVDAIPAALAAWQRVKYNAATTDWLYGQARAWLTAYAITNDRPIAYGRSAAFGGQFTYLLGNIGTEADADLMRVAYDLDVRFRGKDARSQATVHRREFAWHKFFGNLEQAVTERAAALAAFRAYPLPRHLGSAA